MKKTITKAVINQKFHKLGKQNKCYNKRKVYV